MATYRTYVEFDADAQVWVTGPSDIPGLAAEDPEIEGLVRELDHMAPDLLRENLYRGGKFPGPPEVEHEVVVIQTDGSVRRSSRAKINVFQES